MEVTYLFGPFLVIVTSWGENLSFRVRIERDFKGVFLLFEVLSCDVDCVSVSLSLIL